MHKKQLREVYEKIKQWCDANGDEELQGYCEELAALLGEEEGGVDIMDSSNPPGGPPNPPGAGG